MLRRRDFTLTTTSATLGILLSNSNVAASEDHNSALSFSGASRSFEPRVTVGNGAGAALDMPNYLKLVVGIPRGLLSLFVRAVRSFSGRHLRNASTAYVEFRIDASDRLVELATANVAKDISSDRFISRTLSQAIGRDLELGRVLLENDNIRLSTFREQMNLLRDQIELLRLEKERAAKGTALYLATEPELERSGLDSTELLKKQIASLKEDNQTLSDYCSRLESFALKHG